MLYRHPADQYNIWYVPPQLRNSYNVRDFIALDIRWKRQGRSHAGIVASAGVPPFGDLLHRVIRHLNATMPELQHDTALWLP